MSSAGTRSLRPVAVIGAMAEEVERLRSGLHDAVTLLDAPFRVQRGTLAGVPVLLAECGVGKVNAAALTQFLVGQGARSCVFTGVAGATAQDLEVGDVVISDSAVQHDVDVTALGYAAGTVPGSPGSWLADAELVALATAVARTTAQRSAADGSPPYRVKVGTVATGDQFISSPERAADLRDQFGAVCAEMEGAACAQVCAAWGVPFVIVRSISDNANHTADVDFRSFTKLAAERADRIVTGILEALADE
ncbi:MAG TPA: 5'-methylthioadenosine/adenosylhomocysteine nucleosidase [Trueperaceae bacterium]|nr:5'-methylthioadenosine/adenosylhomocysteine nucleosidase [Trueperaceae bacterium]